MIGFKKLAVSDEFIPSYSEIPVFEGKELVSSSIRDAENGKLFFMPSALRELDEHIHWGEYRRDNRIEQGGILIGNVYKDKTTQVLFAIVAHLIPMHRAVGSPGLLKMGLDASYDVSLKEQEMIDESGGVSRRVGWYHTHPGMLDVFMSGQDMETQIGSYSLDWQYAVVLNPQKMIWRGFRGKDAVEIDCIMVCNRNDHVSSKYLVVTNYNHMYKHTVVPYEQVVEQQKEETEKDETLNTEATAEVSTKYKKDDNSEDHKQKTMYSTMIRDRSVCVGGYIIPVDAFVNCLYSFLKSEATENNSQSIAMDICYDVKFENDTWELENVRCLHKTINTADGKQIKMDCPSEEKEEITANVTYAIVHFMYDITKDEAELMISRYRFDDQHDFLLIINEIDEKTAEYFMSDRENNVTTNMLV